MHALMSISQFHTFFSSSSPPFAPSSLPVSASFALVRWTNGECFAHHIISYQKTMQLLTTPLDLLDFIKTCTSLSAKCTFIHSSALSLAHTHIYSFTLFHKQNNEHTDIFNFFRTGTHFRPLKLFARK